jgi:monoamine oxidase
MPLTRRAFLTRVGQAGGAGAALFGMQALGLTPLAAGAQATPPIAAAPQSGNGTSVVILGGGIAGLVAAYELRALGYHCTLLEARDRPGGRNWTVRGGDQVDFLGGTKQTCAWEKESYQNFGPGRLPSTHKTMLGYCRKLGVRLEVEVNSSRSALFQGNKANGGKPVVERQADNDTRGYVSEMLSKCVRGGALDHEMTAEDTTRMLDFLHSYGPLDQSGKYVGSERAGYAKLPGAGEDSGVFSTPLGLHTLLEANFWDGLLYEEAHDWQATMMQPVGGMDRIPYAFAQQLGDIIRYSAPVTEIARTPKGVRVAYTHENAPQTLEADFCFCAMPLVTLRKVKAELSPAYRKVVEECSYAHYYKVAWESRRFWEQDYNVYGGLEFVTEGPSPLWLPSAHLASERGIIVSGYNDAGPGTDFAKLSFAAKLAASRASVERLHPGHGKELEKPIYVNWGKIPWNEGSWIASYGPGQPEREASEALELGHPINGKYANPGYETLLQPDGPIYFVGDHVSYLVGWQEGAALSSLHAINLLAERVKQTAALSEARAATA